MKTDVSLTHRGEFADIASVLRYKRSNACLNQLYLTQLFLGRPPFLPHRERFLRCLRVVAFPPFLPMHRGQISLVMGCIEQYVSLRTTYFYPKRPMSSHPLAFFFLCRLASPSPTAGLCVFPRSPVLHRTQCIWDRSVLYVSAWGRMA